MTATCGSGAGLTPVFTFAAAAVLVSAGLFVVVFELPSLQAISEGMKSKSAIKMVVCELVTNRSPSLWCYQKPDRKEGLRLPDEPSLAVALLTRSQNSFLLSKTIVTGPSFTNSTCIIDRKSTRLNSS